MLFPGVRAGSLPALSGRWLFAALMAASLPGLVVAAEPFAAENEWVRVATLLPFALLSLRAFASRPGRFWLTIALLSAAEAASSLVLSDARFPGRATGTMPNPTLFCEAMVAGIAASLGMLIEPAGGRGRRRRWLVGRVSRPSA